MSTSTQHQTDEVDLRTVSIDDIFIPVMGMTGSGKSTFIEACCGRPLQNIGHGLESYTRGLTLHTIHRPGRAIHLIDTPGFDDTDRTDTEVLQELAFWLHDAHQRGIRLAGILYLHRITDNRLQGSALQGLQVFKEMCGREAFCGVVMVTTRWDVASQSGHAYVSAATRQQELAATTSFWGDILAGGGRIVALRDGLATPRAVIDEVIGRRHALVLKLQLEMATTSVRLHETGAGRVLGGHHFRELGLLEELLAKTRDELEVAVRTYHDRNVSQARQEMRQIRQRVDTHKRAVDALSLTVGEVSSLGSEVAAREREALGEMLQDLRVGSGADNAEGVSAIRAVQRRHLPSLRVGDWANVVSALAGVTSVGLAAAGVCTVM